MLDFCDEKELCVANTWLFNRKVKSLIAWMHVKQKLILCLWEKNAESKECFQKFDIILQSNNFGSSCLNDFKFTQHL